MKLEEAEVILGAVESIYRAPITQMRELWISTLEQCDGEAASEVVIRQWAFGKNLPRYRPDLPELILAIRAEERQARNAPAPSISPLIPFNPAVPPKWFLVWKLARAGGDIRVLPEQEDEYRRIGLDWPPEQGIMPPERIAQLEARLDG